MAAIRAPAPASPTARASGSIASSGLASTAPGPLGKHGVVFTGGTAGTFTIYLDNLRIRHADGSTTPLWTNGKDTRAGKFKENEFFKDLQVRTVNAAEVGK